MGQLQQLDGTPIVSAGTRVTDAQWRLRFVPPNGGAGRYTFEFNLVPSPGNSGTFPVARRLKNASEVVTRLWWCQDKLRARWRRFLLMFLPRTWHRWHKISA